MLVVDSSVWVSVFNGAVGARAHEADLLEQLLDHGELRIVVPDLVLFEVLRGFRHERDLRQARSLMQGLSVEPAMDEGTALAATEHYRNLRSRGHTVRNAIDVLVATFCIEHDYALLHNDRDYEPFEQHRGLRVWRQ